MAFDWNIYTTMGRLDHVHGSLIKQPLNHRLTYCRNDGAKMKCWVHPEGTMNVCTSNITATNMVLVDHLENTNVCTNCTVDQQTEKHLEESVKTLTKDKRSPKTPPNMRIDRRGMSQNGYEPHGGASLKGSSVRTMSQPSADVWTKVDRPKSQRTNWNISEAKVWTLLG